MIPLYGLFRDQCLFPELCFIDLNRVAVNNASASSDVADKEERT